MNDPIDQPQQLLFEREDLREVGEEQLTDINGGAIPEGVLNTPGRGVWQRSQSASGRLQGHSYIGEVFTPLTASPARSTGSSLSSSASIHDPVAPLPRHSGGMAGVLGHAIM